MNSPTAEEIAKIKQWSEEGATFYSTVVMLAAYTEAIEALRKMVHESQRLTGEQRLHNASHHGSADPGSKLRRLYNAQCDAEAVLAKAPKEQ